MMHSEHERNLDKNSLGFQMPDVVIYKPKSFPTPLSWKDSPDTSKLMDGTFENLMNPQQPLLFFLKEIKIKNLMRFKKYLMLTTMTTMIVHLLN